MKMKRFAALLLCLAVLMTTGSALGAMTFQDEDGNSLTGRELAQIAFDPDMMAQMYSASLTILTQDLDAEVIATLQEYYSIVPITNDDGSPAEILFDDLSYIGFRDASDGFNLLFYNGNEADTSDHIVIQSKYETNNDDEIIIPLAAALFALELLSDDGEITDWFFSAQSGDSYENAFYNIFYFYEANMDILMVFAKDDVAGEDAPEVEMTEEEWAQLEAVDGLEDLTIWNETFIYSGNDRAVSIYGLYGMHELPDSGELEIPSMISDRPVVQIGSQAFSGNGEIIRVTVPASVSRIREGAFDDMAVLTEVILEDGVERLEKTFQNCPKLINVCIPASVTSIDEAAFKDLNPFFHLTVERGSYADEYAQARGIACLYIGEEGGSVALEPGNIVAFGSYNDAPLEWIVLEVQDGEAMLLARDVIGAQAFSAAGTSMWADSSVRSYLNGELFYQLFSMDEADILTAHEIYDPASPYSTSCIPGSAGVSPLFLLSYFEARDLLPTDEARSASTDWWLRTAREYGSEYAHFVSADGAIREGKDSRSSLGIRPALWVRTDRAEGIISLIDNCTWPEVQEEGDGEFGVGSTIQFGSYEQDNDDTNGREPLTWQVLSINGSSATLITKHCIDVQQYHSRDEAVNWGETTLRNWLNGEFFNAAFTPEEQGMMLQTAVENFNTDFAQNSYMPSYMIDPVVSNDMVWILDYDEARGFFPETTDSLAYPTNYAYAKGVSTNNEGYAHWMLRTEKNDRYRTNIMLPYEGGASVAATRTDVAIRPVIRVNLVALGIMEGSAEEAAAAGSAEETAADWNSPFATIVSRGDSNANNGTILSSEMLGKVLQVENQVGGWFRLTAPSDGDYNFSVLAPDLSRDSFCMEISVSDEKRASLLFEKSDEVQTLTLPGIKAGEVITWWDNDNSGRWWTMLDPYKLMITIGDSADVPEAPTPDAGGESAPASSTLAEGESIVAGEDLTMEWEPVEGVDEYYIALYKNDGGNTEFVWEALVYEREGLTATIPGEDLQAGSYVIEFVTCKGYGTWYYEEFSKQRINISVIPGNGSTSGSIEADVADAEGSTA